MKPAPANQLSLFAPAPATPAFSAAAFLAGFDVARDLFESMSQGGQVQTPEQSAAAEQAITELWARAEQRYQDRERPLRFTGCSYYVVDSGQATDRAAWLSEAENLLVQALQRERSLYENDPCRAHARNLAHWAERRARRARAEAEVGVS